MYNEQEILEFLKSSRIMKNLPDEVLVKLIPLSRCVSFKANEIIMRERQPNNHIYFLMVGTVSVFSNGEFIVNLCRKGDILGEMSVITGGAATASVIADCDVELLAIRAADIGKYDLTRMETIDNTFFRLFSRILAEKLTITTEKARKHEIANRELLETQKKLESVTEEAVRASKAKSVFLALMSHEVRTPLNSIIGNTELLYYTDLDNEQENLVETIYRSGETLLTTIDNILDYTNIEAGALKLECQNFNLKTLFDNLHELFDTEFQGRNIEFSVQVGTEVAASYKGDSQRIEQVLKHIIGNSLKFTTEGSVRVIVKVIASERDEDTLEITISDTGIGIPDDKLEDIFDMFSQVDLSTTREYGGSGVGLAICRNLVQLMGGDISVQSRKGLGSTFTFHIRLSRLREASG